jgi:hypothetical protein
MTLPAVTPQINVDEYQLSRVQANLTNTTDSILGYLGALAVNLGAVIGTTGAFSGDVAIAGNLTVGPLARIVNPDLPVQISAPVNGVAYYAANKNGAYALLVGYDTNGVGGAGGYVRMVNGEPLNFVVNNGTLAAQITSTGAFNAPHGITQGSRFVALNGRIGQNLLATNGTYTVSVNAPGSTPGIDGEAFNPAFPGSIAAITAKVYAAAATAGTITFTTQGATTNPTTPVWSGTSGQFVATFTPGQYPFVANSPIFVTATSSGWVQPAGTTGIQVEMWVYC